MVTIPHPVANLSPMAAVVKEASGQVTHCQLSCPCKKTENKFFCCCCCFIPFELPRAGGKLEHPPLFSSSFPGNVVACAAWWALTLSSTVCPGQPPPGLCIVPTPAHGTASYNWKTLALYNFLNRKIEVIIQVIIIRDGCEG